MSQRQNETDTSSDAERTIETAREAVEFPIEQAVEYQRTFAQLMLNGLTMGDWLQSRGLQLTRTALDNYMSTLESARQQMSEASRVGAEATEQMGQTMAMPGQQQARSPSHGQSQPGPVRGQPRQPPQGTPEPTQFATQAPPYQQPPVQQSQPSQPPVQQSQPSQPPVQQSQPPQPPVQQPQPPQPQASQQQQPAGQSHYARQARQEPYQIGQETPGPSGQSAQQGAAETPSEDRSEQAQESAQSSQPGQPR